jgi:hypothetical protein
MSLVGGGRLFMLRVYGEKGHRERDQAGKKNKVETDCDLATAVSAIYGSPLLMLPSFFPVVGTSRGIHAALGGAP